ncbi:rod shape-determining protein MreC [Sphingomonas sp.]|uniref:rod shape-determining protein MreC n=1 Tax=Sphingomonas sp. TaxID=28214 RepID=UPI00286B3345|nr:rod shape-determining protein MreC [Sphingomonas sp.]
MAGPTGPRPGWSRKAQYSLFFGLVAAIAGLIVGLIMLVISLVAPSAYARVRGAALDITAPVSSALSEVATTVTGVVGGAGDYWNAAAQNAGLKRERIELRRQIIRAKAVMLENSQLKAALGLREQSEAAIAAGRIVGSSFESTRRFAILSVGRTDGVDIGMPVRTPDGLVGRVIEAGSSASRVLLVSDRSNIVPARTLRGGIPVISTGRGDGTVDIRPLEVGRNPFKRGDIIVTSGTGGLYPPLVPIARIIRLDDDGALGLPLADPSKSSFAIVERVFEPAAIVAATAPPPGER